LLVLAAGLSTVSLRCRSGGSWLGYALCCAAAWIGYLLLFWPGLLNADSFDQWQQMETGVWVEHHPVFHTVCNWLLTRGWHSPAAVALAQILVLSAAVGWGLAGMRAAGLPAWLAALTCGFLALTPANGTMVIFLTKDTPFAIALLVLTLLVLR